MHSRALSQLFLNRAAASCPVIPAQVRTAPTKRAASGFVHLWLGLALLAGAVAGCSKSGSNASVLDPAKVPATVAKAFEKAPAETKQEATDFVATFQGTDVAAAFSQLRRLDAQTNLTPQQRVAVAKAMQTTFVKMQTAAQNGDTAAQATMSQYLSSR